MNREDNVMNKYPYDTGKKELELFTSAFSRMFGVRVLIDSMYDDSNGNVVVTASSSSSEDKLVNHLFRANELVDYC